MLVPGDYISSTCVTKNLFWENYILANYRSWYDFATKEQGRILDLEDLVIVRGFLKTSKWFLAAVENRGKTHSISLHFSITSIAQGHFTLASVKNSSPSITQRHGPKQDPNTAEPDTILPRNQTLFLKYYKVKRRCSVPKLITAGAEPRDHSNDSSEDSTCTSTYSIRFYL